MSTTTVQPETPVTFREGDVLHYRPDDRGQGITRHCREGVAVVDDQGQAWDTYWGDSNDHRLSASERENAEVIFNLADYTCLDHNDGYLWEQYRPEDRQSVSHQHGCQRDLYVRRGAATDPVVKVRNARAKVREAEQKLDSARRGLEWARRDLDREQERASAPTTITVKRDRERGVWLGWYADVRQNEMPAAPALKRPDRTLAQAVELAETYAESVRALGREAVVVIDRAGEDA